MPILTLLQINWHAVRARPRAVIYECFPAIAVLSLAAMSISCGTSGATSTPANILITIHPLSATVYLGQAQQFQSTVTGTSNTAVTWSVNGIPDGNSSYGTISEGGQYTAPAVLPNPASITVTATSSADQSVTASATVNLADNISVTVSPATVTIPTLGAQVFTASISATGSPSTAVSWSVNGIVGGNSDVGTIVASDASTATYTAPAVPPSPSTVIVIATSVADVTRSGSSSVTINCAGTGTLTPPTANVPLGQTQIFTASLCVASGAAITWDVNGITGGNNTIGNIVSDGPNSSVYTAPADLPATDPITIHATADPAGSPGDAPISASASVTITSNVSVTVSPTTSTLTVSQIEALAATVGNTPDTSVTWSVNGIPNGNGIVGEICMNASNPCVPPNGPTSGGVEFFAPTLLPATNPVTVIATSHADPTKTGAATVILTGPAGPVSVTIAPGYAFLAPSTGTLSTEQFIATVSGSSNTNLVWAVQGAVAGQGCQGAACGSVSATGLYTAPAAAPNPNAVSVTATSVADLTKSASATIVVTTGPAIETILPSSVMAGAMEAFPLEVQGLNFVPGAGSAASQMLLNGAPQSTTCANAETCTISLAPTQVETAGTYTIQIQNPGSPAPLSNPVPFVIVPFDVSQSVISLTSSAPMAAATNITVFEPTTEAESAPLNVNFIGFLTGGNTCGVQGSPLSVTRPVSGISTVSICVQGNGLDPSFTYVFTSPSGSASGGDIPVTASAITGLFSNTIELDLQLSSTTAPGARTLIITDLNNNQAMATGMLEVN
jgi:hypothetical protein